MTKTPTESDDDVNSATVVAVISKAGVQPEVVNLASFG